MFCVSLLLNILWNIVQYCRSSLHYTPIFCLFLGFIFEYRNIMDTVVKGLLEDDVEEEKKGLHIFGRDLSKIPCFRESFLYGVGTGVGVGLASFIKTSKPLLSQHIGFGSFVVTTLVYWSFCRYEWSKRRFDAQLLQDALKDKILHEGTAIEKELEQKGVLKSA